MENDGMTRVKYFLSALEQLRNSPEDTGELEIDEDSIRRELHLYGIYTFQKPLCELCEELEFVIQMAEVGNIFEK